MVAIFCTSTPHVQKTIALINEHKNVVIFCVRVEVLKFFEEFFPRIEIVRLKIPTQRSFIRRQSKFLRLNPRLMEISFTQVYIFTYYYPDIVRFCEGRAVFKVSSNENFLRLNSLEKCIGYVKSRIRFNMPYIIVNKGNNEYVQYQGKKLGEHIDIIPAQFEPMKFHENVVVIFLSNISSTCTYRSILNQLMVLNNELSAYRGKIFVKQHPRNKFDTLPFNFVYDEIPYYIPGELLWTKKVDRIYTFYSDMLLSRDVDCMKNKCTVLLKKLVFLDSSQRDLVLSKYGSIEGINYQ